MKDILLAQLSQVEQIANYSKFRRFIHIPYRYAFALLYRQFIYPIKKKIIVTETDLFFNRKMKIALPASTDIFLTKGKSHSSEIRLAKFMILYLNEGNHFLDIGAHYGYFTLLALSIVGKKGCIKSFEPTTVSYKLLSDNCKLEENISVFQKAVSNEKGNLIFYEFPNLHSEYNSFDMSQFENEQWYHKSKPLQVIIEATTIDDIISEDEFMPFLIKIDVEGGEYKVIQGGINYFERASPIIVMEYLTANRMNEPHAKALSLLLSLNYHAYIINNDGELDKVSNIDEYLIQSKLESDNIVFKKTK